MTVVCDVSSLGGYQQNVQAAFRFHTRYKVSSTFLYDGRVFMGVVIGDRGGCVPAASSRICSVLLVLTVGEFEKRDDYYFLLVLEIPFFLPLPFFQ
jgi:hypothetical protein